MFTFRKEAALIQEQPKPLLQETCELVPETRAAQMAMQSLWQVCRGRGSGAGGKACSSERPLA